MKINILLADTYGFCFGVKRAVELTEETLAKEKSNIAISLGKTLGILTDIQKIEFEEISTADRLAKFMKEADDEI